MKNLYAGQESLRLRKRAEHLRIVVIALAACSAVLLTVLFLNVRTGNASVMLWIILGSMTLLGWIGILLIVCGYLPAKARAEHLQRLESGEKTVCEGRLNISSEVFRIPRSVPVRKVILHGEAEDLSLNMDADLLPLMPKEGTQLRAETAHRYLTGIELPDGGDPAPRGREAPSVRFLRAVRRIRIMIPGLLAWMIAAGLIGGFIFIRVTDAAPENKIMIYMDGTVRRGAELADRLEQQLPSPIRKVQIRPFTYALFGSDELRSADLYIVPESHLADYGEWFLPGQEGKCVHDPETGLSAAGNWLIYEPETYRMMLGAGSRHLEDGLAEKAAELLLGAE